MFGTKPSAARRAAARAPRRRPRLEALEPRRLLTLAAPIRLDFGPSSQAAVAPGYRAASTAAYSASAGLGWVGGGATAASRSSSDPLTRDFVSVAEGTFRIDLPDGLYDVTPIVGDPVGAVDAASVSVEGVTVADDVRAGAGGVLRATYRAWVQGGSLEVRFADAGGATARVPVAGLEVDAVEQIRIDEAWMAARGSAPYRLDRPHSEYVLAADVRADGTAFVAAATDVTLDLGGRTVTYGDAPAPEVANGGFELGEGRDAPGWDLSGAPSAVVVAGEHRLFGEKVLRLGPFTGTHRVVSDPIAVPSGGWTHAATITPSSSGVDVTIAVVDASTGATLATGRAGGVGYGASAVAQFVPPPGATVRLVVDVAARRGEPRAVDLDEATLTVARQPGIVASRLSRASMIAHGVAGAIPAAALEGYEAAADFTLRNGRLEQGRGGGFASAPIFAKNASGLAVLGVEVAARGVDVNAVDAYGASGHVTVAGSTFRLESPNVTDRYALTSALEFRRVEGPLEVRGNRVLGAPQVGIHLGQGDPTYFTSVTGNELRGDAAVTNGYAIMIAAQRNFEVADNAIETDDGRGISLDAYVDGSLTGEGSIHHNYVSVREAGNREYGGDANIARALRIRRGNNTDGAVIRDLAIHDNSFIAATGPGLSETAVGVVMSLGNDDGRMDNCGIALLDNLIKATAEGAGTVAIALAVDLAGRRVRPRIEGNVLESNDASLALGGPATYDGSEVRDVTLTSNVVRLSADGDARAYRGVWAGAFKTKIASTRMFGTRYEGGATAAIHWTGTGTKSVSVGELLDVTVLNPSGTPRVGASVAVFDRNGTRVFLGETDDAGRVANIPLVTTLYRQTTTNWRIIRTTRYGPFVVRVGADVERTVNVVPDQEISIQM